MISLTNLLKIFQLDLSKDIFLHFQINCSKMNHFLIKFHYTDAVISTPFVAQEVTILKKALHDERAERIRIQAAEMEKILKNLTPIHVPQPKDNRINELERDLMKVKHVSRKPFKYDSEIKKTKENLKTLIRSFFIFNRITSYR